MKKKGFTLIELITILVLLSIIIIISVPILSGVINSSKQKSYDKTIDNIKLAAYQYSVKNDLIKSAQYNTILISTLQSSGFIEDQKIINPIDNTEITGCVAYRWYNNQYEFKYSKDCTVEEVIPTVNINVKNDNQSDYMTENLIIDITGIADNFKFCVGEHDCTPDIDYTGETVLDKTGEGIYICAVGYLDGVESEKVCTDSYNVMSNRPDIDVYTSSRSDAIYAQITCTQSDAFIEKYEYSINDGEYLESNISYYIFSYLTKNTEYKIKLRCTNEYGLYSEEVRYVKTGGVYNPSITLESATPSDTDYSYEQDYKIVFRDIKNVDNYIKFSSDTTITTSSSLYECTAIGECTSTALTGDINIKADVWYKAPLEGIYTFKSNGVIYATTIDYSNQSTSATYTITNIDSTKPTSSIDAISKTVSSITLRANCSDTETGITKYEFSKDGGLNYINNNLDSIYIFENLNSDETYNFKIRCTNGSGLSEESSLSETTVAIEPPIFTLTASNPAGFEYSSQKIIKVDYTTNISESYRYIKSDKNINVLSSSVTKSCGSGVVPENCTSVSTTTLQANVWYEVNKSGTNIIVAATNNGTIYAITSDGISYSATSTYQVTKMDNTVPEVNAEVISKTSNSITVKAACSDSESGIRSYSFQLGSDSIVSNGTNATYTFTDLTAGSSYDLSIYCYNGLGSGKSITITETTSGLSSPTIVVTHPTNPNYNYSTFKYYKVTYNSDNQTSLEHYVKATEAASTMGSQVLEFSCGTGELPTACTENSDQYNLSPNVWYKLNTDSFNMSLESNSTIYAVTKDGENYSDITIYNETNIDTTTPIASLDYSSILTGKVILKGTCTDLESGITKYEFSSDGGENYIDNGMDSTYTFENLDAGTEYNFSLRCTNDSIDTTISQLTSTDELTLTTSSLETPQFTLISTIPSSGYSYYSQKKIRLTYSTTNATSPIYYFKSSVDITGNTSVTESCGTDTTPTTCSAITSTTTYEANTWYKVTNSTLDFTATSDGVLYAYAYDANKYSSQATYNITNIDTSSPTVSLTSTKKSSSSVTLSATCTDDGSGITKYEFSKDGGTTYIDKGTISTHEFTNLDSQTTYNFKVRCTNGSGVTNEDGISTSPSTVTVPTISVTQSNPPGYTYSVQKFISVSYSSEGATSPEYYFKSSVSVNVTSLAVTSSCGTDTVPGTCTTIDSLRVLKPNIWYKIDSTSLSVYYLENGVAYAYTKDGINSASTTYNVTKIDTTAPIVSVAVSGNSYSDGYKTGASVTVTCSDDQSGIFSGGKTVQMTSAQTYTIEGSCINNAGMATRYSYTYKAYAYGENPSCGVKSCATEACGCLTWKCTICQRGPACGYSFTPSYDGSSSNKYYCGTLDNLKLLCPDCVTGASITNDGGATCYTVLEPISCINVTSDKCTASGGKVTTAYTNTEVGMNLCIVNGGPATSTVDGQQASCAEWITCQDPSCGYNSCWYSS